MYEDIANQIIKQEEDKIVYEVRQAIGYNIDKQELVKALQYDRGQYQKGYADAMAVIDDIKAEIEAYQSDAFYSDNVMMNKRMVLDIIDKYRGE